MAYVIKFTEYAEDLLVERVASELIVEIIEQVTDLLGHYPAFG